MHSHKLKRLFTLFAFFCFVSSYAQKSNSIYLDGQYRAFPDELPADQSALASVLQEAQPFNGKHYVVVRTPQIPTVETKEQMAASGIELLSYIPNNSWFAALSSNIALNKITAFGIDVILPVQTSWKMSPNLKNEVFPGYAVNDLGQLLIRVNPYVNISADLVISGLAEKGFANVKTDQNGHIELAIEPSALTALASLPFVQYIELIDAPIQLESILTEKTITSGNYLASEFDFDGTGILISVGEGGIVDTDDSEDYQTRLDRQYESGSASGHKTGVARRMAAAGNMSVYGAGNAYGSDIVSLGNQASFASSIDVRIINHSFGFGCNTAGTYGSGARTNDNLVRTNPNFMVVYSAGNIGTDSCGYGAGPGWANTTGTHKQAKNVIATGAASTSGVITGFSSRGPSPDGRIKPDLVASGPGGTSHAAPNLSGIMAQLYHAYESAYSVLPKSGLIKAIMQTSATDMGNPGPDFIHGYGMVNAVAANEVIQEMTFLTDTLAQGETDIHNIVVPANADELRVMVYWTDHEATSGVIKALVNDLDLTVDDPVATPFLPWVLDHTPDPDSLNKPAIRAIDTLNNMEQITISSPVAGNYQVNIDGSSVPMGPQEYYLVWQIVEPHVKVTYPALADAFVPGQSERIRWNAQGGTGTFDLSYSVDSGQNYTSIVTGLSADTRQYDWSIPSVLTGKAMVRVQQGALSDASSKFTIMAQPQSFRVAWACDDSLKLGWDPLPGATQYEISQLGQKYMDSIGRVNTTGFVINGLTPGETYYFSIRAMNDDCAASRRIDALEWIHADTNCTPIELELSSYNNFEAAYYPDCYPTLEEALSIKVTNNGVATQSNIPVAYRVNGGSVTQDVLTASINSSASADFTFQNSLNLSQVDTYSIESWVAMPGDPNAANDTFQLTIIVYGSASVAIPYSQNFDNFTNCSTAWGCSEIDCALQENWFNVPNSPHLNADSIDFRVHNGGTGTGTTGPSADHTSGSGKYLYTEGSGSGGSGCTNKWAYLQSPCIDLSYVQTPVMDYWYHMYGSGIGELHIDVLENGRWTNDVGPSVSGEQGNLWIQDSADLSAYENEVIVVRFRSKTGSGFRADLAIDDITVEGDTGCTTDPFAPVITCPANISANNQTALCEAVVTYTEPTAFDNCSTPTVTRIAGPASASSFSVGSTLIAYTATDGSGNSDTCSFEIIVVDTTAPVAVCDSTSLQFDSNGIVVLSAAMLNDGSADNCGIASLSLSEDTIECRNGGANQIILTVIDAANNMDTCIAEIIALGDSFPCCLPPDSLNQKISNLQGQFDGQLLKQDRFGNSVDVIGDVNGDGYDDLIVGAAQSDPKIQVGAKLKAQKKAGAAWILFLHSDGSVISERKLSIDSPASFPKDTIKRDYLFGQSVCGIGDLNGDGVEDIAVGAPGAPTLDGAGKVLKKAGAVFICFLNSDGTVSDYKEISRGKNGFDGLVNKNFFFGWSVTSTGDLNGDGIGDIAVGAIQDNGKPAVNVSKAGAIWLVYLNTDGTSSGHMRLSADQFPAGIPKNEKFGSDITAIGDIDGNGVTDLAVGAFGHDPVVASTGKFAKDAGGYYIVTLETDGSVLTSQVHALSEPHLRAKDKMNGGWSLAGVPDLDADGTDELLFGAPGSDAVDKEAGQAFVIRLNTDGSVKATSALNPSGLDKGDKFGSGAAALEEECFTGLFVSARNDDDAQDGKSKDLGAVWYSFDSGLSTPSKHSPVFEAQTIEDLLESESLEAAEQLILSESDLQMIPNPTNGQFRIRFEGERGEFKSLIVYDQIGNRVVTYAISSGDLNRSFRLPKIAAGVYTVVLLGSEKRAAGRLVVVD